MCGGEGSGREKERERERIFYFNLPFIVAVDNNFTFRNV